MPRVRLAERNSETFPVPVVERFPPHLHGPVGGRELRQQRAHGKLERSARCAWCTTRPLWPGCQDAERGRATCSWRRDVRADRRCARAAGALRGRALMGRPRGRVDDPGGVSLRCRAHRVARLSAADGRHGRRGGPAHRAGAGDRGGRCAGLVAGLRGAPPAPPSRPARARARSSTCATGAAGPRPGRVADPAPGGPRTGEALCQAGPDAGPAALVVHQRGPDERAICDAMCLSGEAGSVHRRCVRHRRGPLCARNCPGSTYPPRCCKARRTHLADHPHGRPAAGIDRRRPSREGRWRTAQHRLAPP